MHLVLLRWIFSRLLEEQFQPAGVAPSGIWPGSDLHAGWTTDVWLDPQLPSSSHSPVCVVLLLVPGDPGITWTQSCVLGEALALLSVPLCHCFHLLDDSKLAESFARHFLLSEIFILHSSGFFQRASRQEVLMLRLGQLRRLLLSDLRGGFQKLLMGEAPCFQWELGRQHGRVDVGSLGDVCPPSSGRVLVSPPCSVFVALPQRGLLEVC